ncbi:MAG: hypothetical protein R3Y06_05240 [Faecalibacterium sp.]
MPKKRVFISSTGRTGTQFFAKYLNVMIEKSVSLHEPGTPWFSKPKQLLGQIRDYGVIHLSFGQGSNKSCMYKLSRDFIAGKITKQSACDNILKMNNKVDALYAKDAEVVVYSSGHIYGLLGLIDEIYEDSRFVFILRDPRTWIGSALYKVEYSLYGPIEWFYRKISLQPSCYQSDPYLAQWHSMSKFEKYCWFYNKLNEIVLTEMQDKPNFKVFRYEDVFLAEDKAVHFKELLDFATDFSTDAPEYTFQAALIDNKVDSKQQQSRSTWEDWSPKKAQIMMKHCGKIMQAYGYGEEEAWKEKLKTVTV